MSAAMESSRIFVRSLPPRFTEDDVRKHFGKFPVTDVRFFPHRRIGYVGYKSPEDAAKAVKYFNKTFINLTKIYVEIARPVSIACRCGCPGQDLRVNRLRTKSFPSRDGNNGWRRAPRRMTNTLRLCRRMP
jgi:RNA recognition motif-containing protein